MKRILYESFSWDENNALSNVRKHGIELELAATVFDDPLAVLSRDVSHESAADRWVVVGMTASGLLVFIVHVVDRDGHVRIISARRPTFRERREYETGEYAILEAVMTDEYNEEDESDLKGRFDF
jgi:uncharacterized DUF497 family protein